MLIEDIETLLDEHFDPAPVLKPCTEYLFFYNENEDSCQIPIENILEINYNEATRRWSIYEDGDTLENCSKLCLITTL